MAKLDLITGFLGAGKTTFIKKYARYLMDQGEKICIIENDFGAINVDMVLLKELEGPNCSLEMIVGGDGPEAHKRRLKTKLIAMGMQGFDRVIIEPSGIFDIDEFFDLVYEEPLDRWYEVGNVISIVDSNWDDNMSQKSRYLFMSELANAGGIVFSKAEDLSDEQKTALQNKITDLMKEFKCSQLLEKKTVVFMGESSDNTDLSRIVKCSYNINSFEKMPVTPEDDYKTLFYFDFVMEYSVLKDNITAIFDDVECGKVSRIKGIVNSGDGTFYEINSTRNDIISSPVDADRSVLIVIGEELSRAKLTGYLGEPTL